MELVEMAIKPSSHGLLRDLNVITSHKIPNFLNFWQGVKDKGIASTKWQYTHTHVLYINIYIWSSKEYKTFVCGKTVMAPHKSNLKNLNKGISKSEWMLTLHCKLPGLPCHTRALRRKFYILLLMKWPIYLAKMSASICKNYVYLKKEGPSQRNPKNFDIQVFQKQCYQKSHLSPWYPDHFPNALDCTYFIYQWFCPSHLIHLIRQKYLHFVTNISSWLAPLRWFEIQLSTTGVTGCIRVTVHALDPLTYLRIGGKCNGGVAVWYHQYLLVMLEE